MPYLGRAAARRTAPTLPRAIREALMARCPDGVMAWQHAAARPVIFRKKASFAGNDVHLKASCGSLPPSTVILHSHFVSCWLR